MEQPSTNASQVRRALTLRSFFPTTPPNELVDLLLDRIEEVSFSAGEIIYQEDTPATTIYFMVSGELELSKVGDAPWDLYSPAILGAFDATVEQDYSRTARAITSVQGTKIRVEDYFMILSDFFEFARGNLILAIKATHERSLALAPDRVLPTDMLRTDLIFEPKFLDEVHRLIVLRHSAPFETAPIQALALLAQKAVEERYEPGDIIFESYSENLGVYIVAQGTVLIYHHEPEIRGRLGFGQLLPSIIGFSTEPHPFSAQAQTKVVILRIPHEDMYDLMEEHFLLTRAWWQYLGRENERIRTEISRKADSYCPKNSS